MKRIFIAGPYNADGVCDVLNNVRRGMEAGQELLYHGYLPFNPFLDWFYCLVGGPDYIPDLARFRQYCLELVGISDAVLCLGGQSTHEGVKAELDLATSLKIPVFDDIMDLFAHIDVLDDRECNTQVNALDEAISDLRRFTKSQMLAIQTTLGKLQRKIMDNEAAISEAIKKRDSTYKGRSEWEAEV